MSHLISLNNLYCLVEYGARMTTTILRNIGQRSQLQYCGVFCKEASCNMMEYFAK